MLQLLNENGNWAPRAFPDQSRVDSIPPVVVMEFLKRNSVLEASLELRLQFRKEFLTFLSKHNLCLGDTEIIYDSFQQRFRFIDVGSFLPYPESDRSAKDIEGYLRSNFSLLSNYLGLKLSGDSEDTQPGLSQQF